MLLTGEQQNEMDSNVCGYEVLHVTGEAVELDKRFVFMP